MRFEGPLRSEVGEVRLQEVPLPVGSIDKNPIPTRAIYGTIIEPLFQRSNPVWSESKKNNIYKPFSSPEMKNNK